MKMYERVYCEYFSQAYCRYPESHGYYADLREHASEQGRQLWLILDASGAFGAGQRPRKLRQQCYRPGRLHGRQTMCICKTRTCFVVRVTYLLIPFWRNPSLEKFLFV